MKIVVIMIIQVVQLSMMSGTQIIEGGALFINIMIGRHFLILIVVGGGGVAPGWLRMDVFDLIVAVGDIEAVGIMVLNGVVVLIVVGLLIPQNNQLHRITVDFQKKLTISGILRNVCFRYLRSADMIITQFMVLYVIMYMVTIANKKTTHVLFLMRFAKIF